MDLEIIKVGDLQTNCYLLTIGEDALIIDPGDEFEKIDSFLKDKNLVGVVITHHHFDHVGALNSLVNKYNVKVYDHDNLKEGLNIVGPFKFEVMYTPGHTLDSICLYFKEENIIFVGDFLFYNGIGRTDLGGDDNLLEDSLKKIRKYDNAYAYPGHGNVNWLIKDWFN